MSTAPIRTPDRITSTSTRSRARLRVVSHVPAGERRTIEVADLFAGGGGFSLGCVLAAEELGLSASLIGVNHWARAVETLAANLSGTFHCQDLTSKATSPIVLVPAGRLDLLMASPTCCHHSRARGGRPTNDQSRNDPWSILDWLTQLRVERLVVENVPELLSWGPVDPATGKPVEARKGHFFQAWVRALRALGYRVEWRVLCAADYGDATSRERLFVQARLSRRQPIQWPAPTHSRAGVPDLFGNGAARWRAAAEIIDWSNLGTSMLDRKKALSTKTRLRIARGLVDTTGRFAPHFIRLLALPAADERIWLERAESAGGAVHPSSFVLGQHGGGVGRSVTRPIPTVTTDGALSLITPLVVPYYGTGVAHPADEPLRTVTTKARFALASAAVSQVTPTRAASFLTVNFGERDGQLPRVHHIGDPVPTVTSRGAGNLVTALATGPIEATDDARVVRVDGEYYRLDIYYRMLTSRELARAMGFDTDNFEYAFSGSTEEINRMIGNAVPVHLAAAIIKAALS